MKSGILKNKEFGELDCRCKNGIDEFVILVQCPGYFLRWILTLTALYRFSRIRPWTYLLIFSFLFTRTTPLLSSSPPNSFYFITRLIDIATSASRPRRLYFIRAVLLCIICLLCVVRSIRSLFVQRVTEPLVIQSLFRTKIDHIFLSETSNKIVIFGNASVPNIHNKSRFSIHQTIY